MGFRFTLLIVILTGGYLFLIFNLYQIQLSSNSGYVAHGATGTLSPAESKVSRGTIFFTDKNGALTPVATNKEFPVVYAVPKVLEDPVSTATKLAGILGLTEKDLASRFAKKSSYELLAKKVSDDVAKKIGDLSIKGIYVTSEPFRFYPLDNFASQLLGYVGLSDTDDTERGKYGLEKMYDTALAGVSGGAADSKAAPPAGQDLVTTLDPNIQIESEHLLSDLVKKYHATGGSIIVEDPHTGKILTLANNPSFDPNSFQDAALSTFLNPTTQELYEPGSVFKIITMAAGIDSGKITPDTTYVDTGSLVVNKKTIKNWDLKAYGLMTMTNVVEHSLNIGAAFAERQTGDAIFTSYVKRFGLGGRTGIDLPGEISGNLQNITAKHAPAIAYATAAFGQGISVTPIGIISAFAAVANGGALMRPYVNAALSPQVVDQVIKPDTAAKIVKMMVTAVDTNIIAKVGGYTIAGKTGTAQIGDTVHGGYIPNEYINTYIGFGPASDPKFVILVRLIKPDGAALAGATVVPTFQQLAQFLLNYYNIPPDRIENR
jgi:cell division protein FtsI (penicillin-binding protein 3)